MKVTKRNNKGFTLAEMLIVVAIIGVLIAIVSTTINNFLEKSREAVDMMNIRSALSLLETAVIDDSVVDTSKTFKSASDAKSAINNVLVGTRDGKKYYVTAVVLKQKIAEWQSIPKRPGLMIGKEQFWCTTNPSEKNCFYFCVDTEGNVNKAFWGMIKVN